MSFRRIFYVLIIAGFILGVVSKAKWIEKKNLEDVVSVAAEWKKYGKPVTVAVAKKGNIPLWTKLSGVIAADGTIETYVTPQLASFLNPGQKFIAHNNGKDIEGRVERVSSRPDPVMGMVPVRVRAKGNDSASSGIISVYVQTEIVKNVLKIPLQAVSPSEEGFSCWVINAENRANKRTVQLGHFNREFQEIRTGLRSGDRVVTEGASQLLDGDVVRILEKAEVREAE